MTNKNYCIFLFLLLIAAVCIWIFPHNKKDPLPPAAVMPVIKHQKTKIPSHYNAQDREFLRDRDRFSLPQKPNNARVSAYQD